MLRLSNEESNKLTKECLQTALLQLLLNKSIDKILITELVERAGISRSAFYRNYNTKKEILVDILDQITDNITSNIKSFITSDKYVWLVNFFQTIKDNTKNILLFLHTDILKYLMQVMQEKGFLDNIFTK